MKTPLRVAAFCCFALAACDNSAEVPISEDEGATARGEVLGGSISDDMLPLDTATSQSSPLREEPSAPAETDGQQPEPAEAPPTEADEPEGNIRDGPAVVAE